MTLAERIEQVDELARRQNARLCAGQRRQVAIAGDDQIGRSGAREGDEIVVLRVGGHPAQEWGVIRDDSRSAKRRQQELGIVRGKPLHDVRTPDHLIELAEQSRRDDQIERAIGKEPKDSRRSAVGGNQAREKDAGIDNRPDHLSGGVAFCAHCVKLGMGERHGVVFRQIRVPRPDSFQHADQRARTEGVLDHLGDRAPTACGHDSQIAQYVRIHVHRRLHLVCHRCSIAVMTWER